MKRVCFVDDDAQFEIPLFRDAFNQKFDLICGTSTTDVFDQIRDRKAWQPDLFVLDMYLPSAPPDNAQIQKLSEEPLVLPPDNGELRLAFLNYLAATNRFRQTLFAWNQSAEGGQNLAGKIYESFPNIPIVFYSRKAILQDAIVCMQMRNVVKVVLKPSGIDDEETRKLTLQESSRIEAEFKEAMSLPGSSDLKRIKDVLSSLLRIFDDFFRNDVR